MTKTIDQIVNELNDAKLKTSSVSEPTMEPTMGGVVDEPPKVKFKVSDSQFNDMLRTNSLSMSGMEMPRSVPIDLDEYNGGLFGGNTIAAPLSSDYDELRAEDQSTASKWANGLVKFVGKTGTAIAGGTVGTFAGLFESLEKGEFSKLWDNEIQNSLEHANEWMDKNFPNYMTREEQEYGFFKSLGTANFWANDFLGFGSFVAGAALTEASMSAATALTMGATAPAQAIATTGILARAMNIMRRGRTVTEIAQQMGYGARAAKAWNAASVGTHFLTNASYMGAVTALGYKKGAKEMLMQQWLADHPDQTGVPQEIELQFEDQTTRIGNVVFATITGSIGMNQIVAAPHIFGKGVASLMTDIGIAPKLLVNRGTGEMAGKAVPWYQSLSKTGMMLEKGKAVAKPLAVSSLWGMGSLNLTTSTAMDYTMKKYSPDGINDYDDFMDSFVTGLEQTYGTGPEARESWKSIGMAVLMPLFTIPNVHAVGFSKNKEGKTTFGKRPDQPWVSGGVVGFYNQLGKKMMMADRQAEMINSIDARSLKEFLAKNPELATEMANEIQHTIRASTLVKEIDLHIERGELKEAKDKQDDLIHSFIMTKVLAGVGGWAKTDFSEMIKGMSDESFREMFQYGEMPPNELNQRRENVIKNFNERVDQIESSYKTVTSIMGPDASIADPQLRDFKDQLVYALANRKRIDSRADEVNSEIGKKAGRKIDPENLEASYKELLDHIKSEKLENQGIEELAKDYKDLIDRRDYFINLYNTMFTVEGGKKWFADHAKAVSDRANLIRDYFKLGLTERGEILVRDKDGKLTRNVVAWESEDGKLYRLDKDPETNNIILRELDGEGRDIAGTIDTYKTLDDFAEAVIAGKFKQSKRVDSEGRPLSYGIKQTINNYLIPSELKKITDEMDKLKDPFSLIEYYETNLAAKPEGQDDNLLSYVKKRMLQMTGKTFDNMEDLMRNTEVEFITKDGKHAGKRILVRRSWKRVQENMNKRPADKKPEYFIIRDETGKKVNREISTQELLKNYAFKEETYDIVREIQQAKTLAELRQIEGHLDRILPETPTRDDINTLRLLLDKYKTIGVELVAERETLIKFVEEKLRNREKHEARIEELKTEIEDIRKAIADLAEEKEVARQIAKESPTERNIADYRAIVAVNAKLTRALDQARAELAEVEMVRDVLDVDIKYLNEIANDLQKGYLSRFFAHTEKDSEGNDVTIRKPLPSYDLESLLNKDKAELTHLDKTEQAVKARIDEILAARDELTGVMDGLSSQILALEKIQKALKPIITKYSIVEGINMSSMEAMRDSLRHFISTTTEPDRRAFAQKLLRNEKAMTEFFEAVLENKIAEEDMRVLKQVLEDTGKRWKEFDIASRFVKLNERIPLLEQLIKRRTEEQFDLLIGEKVKAAEQAAEGKKGVKDGIAESVYVDESFHTAEPEGDPNLYPSINPFEIADLGSRKRSIGHLNSGLTSGDESFQDPTHPRYESNKRYREFIDNVNIASPSFGTFFVRVMTMDTFNKLYCKDQGYENEFAERDVENQSKTEAALRKEYIERYGEEGAKEREQEIIDGSRSLVAVVHRDDNGKITIVNTKGDAIDIKDVRDKGVFSFVPATTRNYERYGSKTYETNKDIIDASMESHLQFRRDVLKASEDAASPFIRTRVLGATTGVPQFWEQGGGIHRTPAGKLFDAEVGIFPTGTRVSDLEVKVATLDHIPVGGVIMATKKGWSLAYNNKDGKIYRLQTRMLREEDADLIVGLFDMYVNKSKLSDDRKRIDSSGASETGFEDNIFRIIQDMVFWTGNNRANSREETRFEFADYFMDKATGIMVPYVRMGGTKEAPVIMPLMQIAPDGKLVFNPETKVRMKEFLMKLHHQVDRRINTPEGNSKRFYTYKIVNGQLVAKEHDSYKSFLLNNVFESSLRPYSKGVQFSNRMMLIDNTPVSKMNAPKMEETEPRITITRNTDFRKDSEYLITVLNHKGEPLGTGKGKFDGQKLILAEKDFDDGLSPITENTINNVNNVFISKEAGRTLEEVNKGLKDELAERFPDGFPDNAPVGFKIDKVEPKKSEEPSDKAAEQAADELGGIPDSIDIPLTSAPTLSEGFGGPRAADVPFDSKLLPKGVEFTNASNMSMTDMFFANLRAMPDGISSLFLNGRIDASTVRRIYNNILTDVSEGAKSLPMAIAGYKKLLERLEALPEKEKIANRAEYERKKAILTERKENLEYLKDNFFLLSGENDPVQAKNRSVVGLHQDFMRKFNLEPEKFTNEDKHEYERTSNDSAQEWYFDSLKISTGKSATTLMKLLTAMVPDYYYEIDKKTGNKILTAKRNMLGIPQVSPLNESMAILINKLSNSTSLAEQMVMLENLAKLKPGFQTVIEELGFNKPNPFLGATFDKVFEITQFYQTFAKNRNIFTTIMFGEDGMMKFLDSNFNTVERRLTEKWQYGLARNENYERKLENSIYTLKKSAIDSLPAEGSTEYNQMDAVSALKYLRRIGIVFDNLDYNRILNSGGVLREMELNKLFLDDTGRYDTDIHDEFIKKTKHVIKSIKDGEIENPFEELGTLKGSSDDVRFFVRLLAGRDPDKIENSFRTVSGERAFLNTLNSTATRTINIINAATTKEELFTRLPHLRSTYSQDSEWIDMIFNKETGKRKKGSSVEFVFTDGANTYMGNDGKEYTELNDADRTRIFVNAILRGYVPMFRASDNKIERLFNLGSAMYSYNDIVTGRHDETLKKYLISEIKFGEEMASSSDRWEKGADMKLRGILSDMISEANKKALRAALEIPGSDPESIVLRLWGDKESGIRKDILTKIEEFKQEAKDALLDFGLIEAQDANYRNYGLYTKESASVISEAELGKMLEVFVRNLISGNIEQTKLFVGHPLFYGNVDNFFKRMNAFSGPKKIPMIDEPFLQWADMNLIRHDGKTMASSLYEGMPTLTSLVFKEHLVDIDPVYMQEYKEMLMANGKTEEQADYLIKGYRDISEADGAGIVTLDALRIMMLSTGEWNIMREATYLREHGYTNFPDNAAVYGKYAGKEITNDMMVVFNPVKWQHFGPAASEGFKPSQYKLALYPLLPSLVKRFPDSNLSKIPDLLMNNKADILTFTSATKVGVRLDNKDNYNQLYTPEGMLNEKAALVPQYSFMHNWGIQLSTGDSPHRIVTSGTQKAKHRENSVFENGTPVPMRFEERVYDPETGEIYHSKMTERDANETLKRHNEMVGLVADRISIGVEQLRDRFGLTETVDGYEVKDADYLMRTLQEEIDARQLPSNIQHNLDILKATNSGFDLDLIVNSQNLETILTAIADDMTLSQKRFGSMLIEASPVLFEQYGISRTITKDGKPVLVSSGLRTYSAANGRITSIEVYMPSVFKRLGKEIRVSDIKDKRLLEAIGYRIPTSGLNSIESIIIKEFLPETAGDMIVIPAELVAKSGTDFDVDKLTVELPNFYYDRYNQPRYIEYKNFENQYQDYELSEKNRVITTTDEILRRLVNGTVYLQKYRKAVLDAVNDQDNLSKVYSKIVELVDADLVRLANNMSKTKSDVEREATEMDIEKLEKFRQEVSDMSISENYKLMDINEFKKKAVENRISEIERDFIHSPDNFEQFITPTTNKVVKDAATKINWIKSGKKVSLEQFAAEEKLKAAGKNLSSLVSPKYLIETTKRLMASKVLMGMAALHATDNVLGQQIGYTLSRKFHMRTGSYTFKERRTDLEIEGVSPFTVVDGKRVENPNAYKMSTLKTNPGYDAESISVASAINMELQSIVDAAKDPFILDAGINQMTLGIWNMMVRRGLHPDHATMFLRQPIIDRFLKNMTRYQSLSAEANSPEGVAEDTPKLSRVEVIKKTNAEFGAEANDLTLTKMVGDGKVITIKEMEEALMAVGERDDIGKLTPAQKAVQRKILDDFIRYLDLAKTIGDHMRGTNYDTKGPGRSSAELELKLDHTENMMTDKTRSAITNYNNVFAEGSIFGKHYESAKTIAKMVRSMSSTMKHSDFFSKFKALTKLLNDKSLMMSEEKKITLLERFRTDALIYVLSTQRFKFRGELQDPISSDAERLVMGDYSVPRRIDEIQKSINHPLHNNLLVDALQPVLRTDFDNMKVKHTRLDRLSSDMLTEAWRMIMKSDPKLGVDLAKFSILQSGLSGSIINFSQLMPAEVFFDFFGSALEALPKNHDFAPFYRMFFLMNGADEKLVPSTRGRSVNPVYPIFKRRVMNPEYLKALKIYGDTKDGRMKIGQKGISKYRRDVFEFFYNPAYDGKIRFEADKDGKIAQLGVRDTRNSKQLMEYYGLSKIQEFNKGIGTYELKSSEYKETSNNPLGLDVETTPYKYEGKPEFNKLPSVSKKPTMFYTGVGSRETPPEILRIIRDLAIELEKKGYTVRTGDAKNADAAFREAAKNKEVYTPNDANERTMKIAKEIHPAWHKLDDVGKRLQARNTFQVFGENLDTPSDFLIGWTPDGLTSFEERSIKSGGTGQAIDMASRKGIPVINLARPDWRETLNSVLQGVYYRNKKVEPELSVATKSESTEEVNKVTTDLPVTENVDRAITNVPDIKHDLYSPDLSPPIKSDATIEQVRDKLAVDNKGFEKRLFDASQVSKSIAGLQANEEGKVERYWDVNVERMVKGRTNDLVSQNFIKRLGRDRAIGINKVPDNQIKNKMGTLNHATAESILTRLVIDTKSPNVLKPVDVKNAMDPLDIKRVSGLGVHYKTMATAIEKNFNDLIEIQKKIDPNGKLSIHTEQMVYSNRYDRGGTLDVLVVFSDKSWGILDYKTIFPYNNVVEWKDGKYVLIDDPVTEIKYESYDLQLSDYRNTITEEYGLGEMRFARIIPIQMHLRVKPKDQRSDGNNLTNDVLYLGMGQEMSEFLGQKAVAGEKTEYGGLNKLIDARRNELELLKERVSKLSGDKRAEVNARIHSVRASLNKLLVDKSITSTLDDIGSTILFLRGKDLMGGALSETSAVLDGKPNPNYLDNRTFKEYYDFMNVYANLSDFMSEFIQELQAGTKEEQAKAKTYQEQIRRYVGVIGETLAIMNRKLEERVHDIMDNFDVKDGPRYATTGLSEMFRNVSDQSHPVFMTANRMLSNQFNRVRLQTDAFNKELEKLETEVTEWAKANGVSKSKIMDIFRNPKTMDMYNKLNNDFWKAYIKARKEGNAEFLKQIMKKRDNFNEIYKRKLERQKEILDRRYKAVEGIRTEEKASELIDKELARWKKDHDFDGTSGWLGEDSFTYLEFKPETYQKYMSKEFEYISKHKPLLDVYNKIEEFMMFARTVTDYDIPRNMLPKMRKTTMDMVLSGYVPPTYLWREFIGTMKVRDTDTQFGMRDPQTGKPMPAIPIFYTDPIKTQDGKIDVFAHSNELFKIMSVFGHMIYKHAAMKQIEADMMLLEQSIILNQEGEILKDSKGRVLTNLAGAPLKLIGMKPTSTATMFEELKDYMLYGINYTDPGLTSAKGYNVTKVLELGNHITRVTGIGLRLMPPLAAYAAGRLLLSAEATKSQYFTHNELRASIRGYANKDTAIKQMALNRFFNPHQDTGFERKANKLSFFRARNLFTTDALFYTYRKADENIDMFIAPATARYWGIYTDPKTGKQKLMRIDKLKNLDPNGKSIYDSMTYDKKEDTVFIEGMTDRMYTEFRDLVKQVGSGIRGNMSEEDWKRADSNIYLKTLMVFKNWMPGVLSERFRGISYDARYDLARQGRYRAFASNFGKVKDAERFLSEADVQKFIQESILKTSAKIALDLITFGNYKFKYSELRAKVLYENYLGKMKLNHKDMPFDAFLEMKRGQTRAAIMELRWTLMLAMAMLALSADFDGDDKKAYQESWVLRQVYKVLHRTKMETSFSYDPVQFMQLLRNPVPLIGTIGRMTKTVLNTMDETRDVAFGENSNRDVTNAGYYTLSWLPGALEVRQWLDNNVNQGMKYRQ